jgi:hypothetical protein
MAIDCPIGGVRIMRCRWGVPVAFVSSVLVLATFCLARSTTWMSTLVERPAVQGIDLAGEIVNEGDMFYALLGVDIVLPHMWSMKLAIANQGAGLLRVSLLDSSVVIPSGESYNLGDLTKGKLSASVPPNSWVMSDFFSLPEMHVASGDLVSIYLAWEDNQGGHSGFWRWVMQEKAAPQPVVTKTPAKAPPPPLWSQAWFQLALYSSWAHREPVNVDLVWNGAASSARTGCDYAAGPLTAGIAR